MISIFESRPATLFLRTACEALGLRRCTLYARHSKNKRPQPSEKPEKKQSFHTPPYTHLCKSLICRIGFADSLLVKSKSYWLVYKTMLFMAVHYHKEERQKVIETLNNVMNLSYRLHPERFVKGPPLIKKPPSTSI